MTNAKKDRPLGWRQVAFLGCFERREHDRGDGPVYWTWSVTRDDVASGWTWESPKTCVRIAVSLVNRGFLNEAKVEVPYHGECLRYTLSEKGSQFLSAREVRV